MNWFIQIIVAMLCLGVILFVGLLYCIAVVLVWIARTGYHLAVSITEQERQRRLERRV